MFNLEQAIASWRQQMLRGGIKAPVPLDELESHLRDELADRDVDQRTFDAVVAQFGNAHLLRSEFKKLNRNNMKRKIMIAAALLALLIGSGIIMPALAHYGRRDAVGAGYSSPVQWTTNEITMVTLGCVITLAGFGVLGYAFKSRHSASAA